ncbi:hypothetical protein C2L65_23405 [Paraburkholderia terrae]|uniref:Uncharacterized protein n=1 Tax=Paraburkholderia terrae TaxID=311230 RepID=A0A2I8ET00_9BURK|nr:hypothetical protein C2L65_23405 [Paraburkholderia terrae]
MAWRTRAPHFEITLRVRNIASRGPLKNHVARKPDHGATRVCGYMAHPLQYDRHDENVAAGKQGQRKSPTAAQNFAVAAGVCHMRLWGRRSQWGADVGRKWREWFVRRTAIRDHDDTFGGTCRLYPSERAVLLVNAHGARRPCDILFPTGDI